LLGIIQKGTQEPSCTLSADYFQILWRILRGMSRTSVM
jgi:hypothetical protein